jgi:hypothetical protein
MLYLTARATKSAPKEPTWLQTGGHLVTVHMPPPRSARAAQSIVAPAS